MTTEHNMKLSAVLFDLDGTLLDTAPEFATCLNKLLQEEGKSPIPLQSIRHAVSDGVLGLIQLGFNIHKAHTDYPNLEKRLLAHYAALLGTETQLFSGIENLLHKFNIYDIPWGIVTNKPSRFTQPLVKQIAGLANTAVVVSGDTLQYSKPHPAPLQYAAQQLRIPAHEIVYIGDAPRDIQAAIAAGMPCIAAAYGYVAPEDNPHAWNADLVVNTTEEIFPWIHLKLKGF